MDLSIPAAVGVTPKCRHCGHDLTLQLIDLGLSPVANDYVDPANYMKAEPFYPLETFVCRECRLVQTRDLTTSAAAVGRVASKRPPTPAELADLDFAWRVCKHVKSNAIVLAREDRTVGVGAGQMSRVESVKIACGKAAALANQAWQQNHLPSACIKSSGTARRVRRPSVSSGPGFPSTVPDPWSGAVGWRLLLSGTS